MFHSSLSLVVVVLLQCSSSFDVNYIRAIVPVASPKVNVDVPISIWTPATIEPDSTSLPPATYEYEIDIRRIARLLLGVDLPAFSFFRSSRKIPSEALEAARIEAPSNSPVIIFSHGYLGSDLDLHPLCFHLASKGAIVAAPIYPESLCGVYEVPSSREDLTRIMILDACLEYISKTESTSGRVGFIGHSLGTGISSSYSSKSDDHSPRCCIAGFRSAPIAGSKYLVIASEGDGVCSSEFISDRVEEERSAGKKNIESIILKEFNHIDFLSEETNSAMVKFLSPLLPIAKALKIPLLDFDKFALNPRSKECRLAIEDAVVNFFAKELNLLG